ncbi:unnamed protein product, partial [Cyprideis torosa]
NEFPFNDREIRRKHISEDHIDEVEALEHDNGTVSFFVQKTFHFEEKMSNCSLDDEITLVNMPLIAILSAAKAMNESLYNYLRFALLTVDEAKHFTNTRKVREWLFEGYQSEIISTIIDKIESLPPELLPPGDILPPEYAKGKFGLYLNNETDDGWYNIKNGADDIKEVGVVAEWEYSDVLPASYWLGNKSDSSDSECHKIIGTDGTMFHPNMDKDEKVYIFNTDLCRSIYAVYRKEIEHRGIKGYRYEVPEEVLYGWEKNPDNRCFCLEELDNSEACLGDGLLDLSGCENHVPLIMSLPHFLSAEQSTMDMVAGGLSPSEEEHQTYLEIEPLTGLPLRLAKKVQFNLKISHELTGLVAMADFIKHGNTTILPLVWVNEYTELDEENADRWKDKVGRLIKGNEIGRWVLLAVGLAVAALGAVLFFRGKKRMNI